MIDSFEGVSKQQGIVLYERDFCPVLSVNDTSEATFFARSRAHRNRRNKKLSKQGNSYRGVAKCQICEGTHALFGTRGRLCGSKCAVSKVRQ